MTIDFTAAKRERDDDRNKVRCVSSVEHVTVASFVRLIL